MSLIDTYIDYSGHTVNVFYELVNNLPHFDNVHSVECVKCEGVKNG